jgi:hypothetical protein
MVAKGVWPTDPRDFVIFSTWFPMADSEGTCVIISKSFSDDYFLPKKGYVRGQIVMSGYIIQPLECVDADDPIFTGFVGSKSGKSKLTLVAHTELGGNLPSSVINMLSCSAPVKIFTALEKVATKS